MGRTSQLSKLTTHGKNSAYEYAVTLKSLNPTGSNTVAASIEVNGYGNDGDTLTATVNIGAGNLTPSYEVLADGETAETMATALAAAINGETDVTAVSTGNVVQVTKSTAGTVTIVSAVVS
jgi:phage tail sheath gpL-like